MYRWTRDEQLELCIKTGAPLVSRENLLIMLMPTIFYSLRLLNKLPKNRSTFQSAIYWDTYDIDNSIDLYGGGGIACSTRDLAIFFYGLFNYKVIKDTAIFNLIFTEVPTKDPEPSNYYLGISYSEYLGYEAYGHSGYWRTIALYFPGLETSIAVFVLERDKRGLRQEIVDQVLEAIIENTALQ